MFPRAREVTVISLPERRPYAVASGPERWERHPDDLARTIRLALEHLPHGVLILGHGGRIVAANGAAERIFAYGPGRLVGRPISDLVPEIAQHLDGAVLRRS